MKIVLFLLVALLALISLAVPFHEQRSPAISTRSDANTTGSPKSLWPGLEYPTDVDHNVASEIDELFNATATGLETAEWPEDEFAVEIRTGGPKAHVGTLRKQRLYKAVYDCLQLVGHQGHGLYKDHSNPLSPNICNLNESPWCQLECQIPNIVYEAGSRNYATNAHLKINAAWSELYESKHAGIRDLAYKLIANIYRLATDNPANCYTVNFESSRRTTVCNVPTDVLVVWPARGKAPVQARVNIRLFFNGKTEFGNVDCNGGLRNIAWYFKDNIRPSMAKVMGWAENKIRLFNSCQKQECFDNCKDYAPEKPWVEPKQCVTPEHYWEEIS